MLEFAVLSSGSKANCLYVSDGEHRVLVDCGLSSKKVCERLRAVGVEPDTISAILVTHEHSDHIAGIPVFQRRYNPLLAVNAATLSNAPSLGSVSRERISIFESGREFRIGNMVFDPFSVMHDASDPVGFRIRAGANSLAVVTDLGQVTDLVRDKTRGVNALILECNHELDMLWEAPYPWELKQRIRSRFGHLSNEQAAEFFSSFTEVTEPLPSSKEEVALLSQSEVVDLDDSGVDRAICSLQLRYVIAGHISEKSNRPDVALDHLRRAGEGRILASNNVASPELFPHYLAAGPYEPTPLFRL